jgi:hypothetical protein
MAPRHQGLEASTGRPVDQSNRAAYRLCRSGDDGVSKRARCRQQIAERFGDPAALEQLLLRDSALPGRRANLELAAALADEWAERGADEVGWRSLLRWSAITPADAPTNDPREFLPFCAAQAAGALYAAASPLRRRAIVKVLRSAANDERWRMREAAALGLQRIGEADFSVLEEICGAWLDRGGLLTFRAVLAALAHPPFLEHLDRARFALAAADAALRRYAELDATARETPAAVALRKGLEYAPSVFVAALPQEGFALLERWACSEELHLKKVVASNLRKARLARHYPDEVEAVGDVLTS